MSNYRLLDSQCRKETRPASVAAAMPQVRGSAYFPFIRFMEKAGARLHCGLDESLLPEIVQGDPEALVPVHLAHAFLDSCARATGLEDLGFVVGQQARLEDLGAFGRSLRRSLTLHDALGKIRSKFALYSSAERIWWTRAGASVQIFHAYTATTGAGCRYAQQCALLLLRDLVRRAAGPAWDPEEVFVTDPARDTGIVRRVFKGAHVLPSQFAGFAFEDALLSLPLGRFRSDSVTGDYLDLTDFESSAPAGDFAGSIRQVIATLMRHGKFQLHDIAAAVGMHPRTLQRRLWEAGEEYSELLAQVRFEAALRLLRDPDIQVIDVALELGYADPSNFARAFRHWTGISPSRFRRPRPESH